MPLLPNPSAAAAQWLHPATAFGLAGVVANLVWPLLRQRTALLAGQAVACALMLTHFALLGAATGALVMLVAGVQALLAIPLGKAPRFRLIYLGSLLLTPLVCAWSWQGVASVFSSLALALVCVANYQLAPLRQRVLLLTAILAWAGHNLLVASFPGLLSNTLALAVSAGMLFRLHRASLSSSVTSPTTSSRPT